MNKKEFAEQMLKLLIQFQAAHESDRKKIGKSIVDFFQKNGKLSNGKLVLNDPDLQYVGFAAELNDYRKETFSEDDLEVAKSVLRKVIQKNNKP